jgi:hypothetical protein
MGEVSFVTLCKREVVEYVNHRYENIHITENDVYVVWLCKTLQNNKALLSTIVEDGMYYEITYNGDKGEMYFDAYKKVDNYTVVV